MENICVFYDVQHWGMIILCVLFNDDSSIWNAKPLCFLLLDHNSHTPFLLEFYTTCTPRFSEPFTQILDNDFAHVFTSIYPYLIDNDLFALLLCMTTILYKLFIYDSNFIHYMDNIYIYIYIPTISLNFNYETAISYILFRQRLFSQHI